MRKLFVDLCKSRENSMSCACTVLLERAPIPSRSGAEPSEAPTFEEHAGTGKTATSLFVASST